MLTTIESKKPRQVSQNRKMSEQLVYSLRMHLRLISTQYTTVIYLKSIFFL